MPSRPSHSSKPEPTKRTPSERSVFQVALARELGLSQSAVSLALRGKPGVSEATRSRVQAAAHRMGYTPDPMLTALAHYRSRQRVGETRATLAWLHSDRKLAGHWPGSPWAEILRGAKERALELGFRLEPHWLREHGDNVKALERVLLARGITAGVVAPLVQDQDWMPFISKFNLRLVAVCFYAVPLIQLDHVAPDHFFNARYLVREVEAAGFKRPLVALTELLDQALNGQQSSVFSSLQAELANPCRWRRIFIPPSFSIDQWLEAFNQIKPDLLVFPNAEVRERMVKKLPEEARPRVQKVPFSLLCHPGFNRCHEVPGVSGIDENLAEVGAASVDTVANLLALGPLRNEGKPRRILIEGDWIAG